METNVCFTRATIGIPYSVQLKTRWPKRSFQPKRNHLAVVSVLTPSTSTNGLKTESTTSYSINTITTKNVYKDSWINRVAINYLSKTLQDTAGVRNDESGYDSLVVAAEAVFRSFDTIQQRQIVVKALQNVVPAPVAFLIRKVMPSSKFSREYFAAFTTIFFPWLVGPCEVKESEFDGGKEKNVVHITKCRVLESTNCAGLCTNLCKIPSQEFIKNSFGIPVYMVPNFDDMSCEMIYGQEPPPLKDDPAFKQPCYKLLTLSDRKKKGVTKIQNAVLKVPSLYNDLETCDVKNKHDTNCVS